MNKKIKSLLWVIAMFVTVAPSMVFAAVEWGLGTDKDGKSFIGVGSAGSGAVRSAGAGGSGGIFSLNNNFGLPSGSILGIIQNLLFWLLTIFGIAGIFGFVISGIMYLISTGDQGMIDRAKAGMTYSIVGIIVGLSGFLILQAINSWLGGSNNF